MKTNRMIVIVNELIESTDRDEISTISHQSLYRAYRDSDKYSLCWDDIFIGNRANWSNIKDRIEEYILLSHLREGKLEVIYYSFYDKLESLFNSSYQDHLQFYDTSIAFSDLNELRVRFDRYFQFEWIRLEGKEGLFPTLEKKPVDSSAFQYILPNHQLQLKSA